MDSNGERISLTIGVGTSAGGLSALKAFVRTLPTDAGYVIVIVQPAGPDRENRLVELLDPHSTLPVHFAEHGWRLVPDTIYVIPPDRYLALDDGTMRLSKPAEKRGSSKAIDHFFASLAADRGPRCAGILMSGSGDDGTVGLAAIKAAGGLTIAQDPSTAEHACTSSSAISASVIDAILPVEQIPEALSRYVGSGTLPGAGGAVRLQSTIAEQLDNRAESRERQQSAVANLGMLSLAGVDAGVLIEHAVRQVADVLQVDLCKVLQYRPDTNDLLVIAGVGLDPGIVGHATVPADKRSQAGYTLMSQQPVIVDRLSEETRFTGANLLFDHNATSGVSCLIKHGDPPFGVLAVHTLNFRKFTRDDANFLVSVANLLSTTLRAKVINERLRDSEEQFRTMANSIPQLAWITDPAGEVIWYNQQWFDFTGTTFEQMKGWGWRDVHHPDHVERVVTRFQRFIESGSHWEDTFPLRGRNGEYRWFLSRAQPIRSEGGEVVRWFGTNTDITQHRQQEKALRSSEEKLRLAINTNEIGTFEIYLQEERTTWDPVLLRVWGVAQDETPTQVIFWEGVHPDDVNKVHEALDEATDPAGDGHYHVTYRVLNRQSGEQSWIEASGQTLFEDGEPLRMVGLVIDITERKDLEESLKKAVGELQQADSRKNEFLAVLGHELRNPLAALNNSVDMLSLMPDAVDDVLGIMRNSVRTMGRLLDDLLDLNRISQDKIQLDLLVVDVGKSLRKALEYATGECEKRHQTLKSMLDDRLFVLGDTTRLEQIFVNLLTNACKYTQQGGRISVVAERDGNDVVIEIRDTGIGIEAVDLERIFDPFYQVKGRGTSGLGIGLALSRKLAELHGATIHAASEGHNRGTTFTVRIPAYSSAAIADDPESSGAWAILRPGLAVVLIDDNEDILRTLPGLLESLQCRVRTARTAEYGLELARSTDPDAVLIDIGLPDRSGHEVARSLRADGYAGLLVAISGYGHSEARERSTEVGFDYHLAKPAKLKDIASVLARVRMG
jgi:PAS domain S-box-containing protein